jgi:SAM-dependent methyltransferase
MVIDAQRQPTLRKLNVGCGAFKIEGFLNLDADARAEPDVVYNLNDFPYPFPSESFELIEANHILEHLDDPFRVMKELHRLLVKDGTLVIRVPHFSRGFTHAEHKRGFDVTFPYYFNPAFPGGYTGAEFELEEMKLVWFSQPYLKKLVLSKLQYYVGASLGFAIDLFANLSPVFCSRLWCFWVGGFEEIEFRFARR